MPTIAPELPNALRALSMDAVQAARSGHPGAPMGLAEVATVLWRDYLKHNPGNPKWPDRDRFVLSNGHASALLYSLLHLTGYDLGIEDLKNFRQLHSRTPGHPELDVAPGVETTTGPLGQGLANAVGMALAEQLLAAQFNRPGHSIVDHRTFAVVGDGCLMEGVSHEVCSLAGHLELGKLIVLYDDNGISIDGPVSGWFRDDTPQRFRAYRWGVIEDVDGHDPDAVARALDAALADQSRPTLICCKTVIGRGAPNKQGSAGVHGAPLGDEEIAAAREALSWPHSPFVVPDTVRAEWDRRDAGEVAEAAWRRQWSAYADAYPDLAAELGRRFAGELPDGWARQCDQWTRESQQRGEAVASRQASQIAIGTLAAALPELVGGSADLTDSNKTRWPQAQDVAPSGAGNYLYYGVREFGMTAVMNGLALHGGLLPFGGTFLTFSDYARNAVRMAALMEQRVVLVYSHDSIGLGEDGPTHQPVEQLASLRLIPNLSVWRPCDAVETLVAWQCAVERRSGPTALALSRQTLPHQERDETMLEEIRKGAYVLAGSEPDPQVILIATGSEVALAMDARQVLEERGIYARVVSMPNPQRFEAQAQAYREQVLPDSVRARVTIEAGSTAPWFRYAGEQGVCMGLDGFGASAPGADLYDHFDLTVDAVVVAATKCIDRAQAAA